MEIGGAIEEMGGMGEWVGEWVSVGMSGWWRLADIELFLTMWLSTVCSLVV